MEQDLKTAALQAMRAALFLLESPLNDRCIRESPRVALLRETIARLEAA
jgi:hypothetical protein